MVLISNNQARLVSIPVSKDRTLQLSPGANQVDDKSWAVVAKYETVKRELELGNLEVLDNLSAEGNPLPKMNAKDAAALVKKTMDPKLLRAWFEGEKREPVLKAFTAQFKALAEVSGKN
jgi:DNA-directed RNA polymerase subunit H (RpoH/RPB5)